MSELRNSFQLGAALDRSNLSDEGRVYQDLTVKQETLENADAVYAILDNMKNGVKKTQEEPGFQECFDTLITLARGKKLIDFYDLYQQFSRKKEFLESLVKRLQNQKIHYSLDEAPVSLWTITSCDEIFSNLEDPALDIVEDATGNTYALFLSDIMRNLVAYKSRPFGKRVL